MTYEQLRSIADDHIVTCEVSQADIVKVRFAIYGVQFEGQFDSHSGGIYAFYLDRDEAHVERLFEILASVRDERSIMDGSEKSAEPQRTEIFDDRT